MTAPDLNADRPPSAWRRLLKTRTRRITGRYARKHPDGYRQTLTEIAEIAVAALGQHDADR